MKIGILGGSFNPPHWGHLLVAHQVLDFTGIDFVWLTPCYRHTFAKDLAKVEHRLKMTKMLTGAKIKFCSEEIENKLSGETIELMELLAKKYPQHQFSFIIGSDNLKDFKKWGQWEKLVQKTLLLIFPRPGFDFNLGKYGLDNPDYDVLPGPILIGPAHPSFVALPNRRGQQNKFHLIRHPLLVASNISSTNVRVRVKKGLSITSLVPESVERYIKKHSLYA